MIIASFREFLAFSKPATSSHETFGFSVTMAFERLLLKAEFSVSL